MKNARSPAREGGTGKWVGGTSTSRSQDPTACRTCPGRRDRACVSPASTTIRDASARPGCRTGPGPVHHEHAAPRRRSSSARERSGRPGGCSGKASATTARLRRPGGTADQPRAVAAAALHQRHPRDLPAQRLDDLQPRRVLPVRRAGRARAPDPVRLQDPGHGGTEAAPGVPRREQVRAVDAAARAVREREQERRPCRLVQFDPGGPAACHDLHPGSLAAGARAGSREAGHVHGLKLLELKSATSSVRPAPGHAGRRGDLGGGHRPGPGRRRPTRSRAARCGPRPDATRPSSRRRRSRPRRRRPHLASHPQGRPRRERARPGRPAGSPRGLATRAKRSGSSSGIGRCSCPRRAHVLRACRSRSRHRRRYRPRGPCR